MKNLKKVWKLFSSMPVREKVTVVILTAIFFIAMGQFLILHVRFPASVVDDVFVEGMVGQIHNINPLLVDFNDTDRDISELVFSGLIRYDPTTKNFYPDLAAEWKRNTNGLIYTITLRNNALWHDKEPVMPEDVLFTFNEIIKSPTFRNPMLKNAFDGVKVEKTSDQILTFTLPKSNSFFLSNLTVGILPKHILEGIKAEDIEKNPFNTQPIGSGPYTVDGISLNARTGDTIDLVAFDDYYDKKPLIKHIRFLTFPNEEILIDEKVTLHSIAKIDSGSNAQKSIAEDPRFNIFSYSLNQFTALYFNIEQPFLQTPEVRRALRMGLNKEELLAPGQKRIDTIGQSEQKDNPQFEYNEKKAGEELDKLGFKLGTDGILINDKNEKFTLRLLTNDKMPENIADGIKRQWQSLGLKIELTIANSADFFRYISERRYDLILIRQNLGYNRDIYPLFHSSQMNNMESASTGLNFSNYKSFKTDGLTEAIRKEQNPPDKEKLFVKLSNVITEEIPVIFISTPVYSYAIDKRVSAFNALSLDYHSDRLSVLPYQSFTSNN